MVLLLNKTALVNFPIATTVPLNLEHLKVATSAEKSDKKSIFNFVLLTRLKTGILSKTKTWS